MHQQINELVGRDAITIQRFVVAPHAAIRTVLPAEIGNFHHAANEDFRAEDANAF
jgi:hypothetical protein